MRLYQWCVEMLYASNAHRKILHISNHEFKETSNVFCAFALCPAARDVDSPGHWRCRPRSSPHPASAQCAHVAIDGLQSSLLERGLFEATIAIPQCDCAL